MKRIQTYGFTIIELIVVIVVIGILTGITVVTYPSIQAESRDAERISRTKIISEALEKYYSANGEYPSCALMTATPASSVTNNTLKGTDPNVLASPIAAKNENSITACSGDPTTGSYVYQTNTEGSAYILKYYNESDKTIASINSRHGSIDGNIAISTPATPTVAATTELNSSKTTWSWNSAPCEAGQSAKYQYRYTILKPGDVVDYDSGLMETKGTSLILTTSTGARNYNVAVQAKCYNTVSSSNWSTAGSANYIRSGATGGNMAYVNGYTVHTFTSSGTLSILGSLKNVEVLVVAAGRSGVGDGGAGGAGGQVLPLASQNFSTSTISIVIGTFSVPTSSFGSNIASGTGAAGGAPSGTIIGNSGATGALSSITGTAKYYGGGGGGGAGYGNYQGSVGGVGGAGGGGAGGSLFFDEGYNCGHNGTNGTPNTGGGGGGGASGECSDSIGGTGGSGIVIIRYLTLQ